MSAEQTTQVSEQCLAGASRAQRYRPYMRRLLLIGALGLWGALYYICQPKDGLGTDFYPLYRAGQALLDVLLGLAVV